MRGWRIEPPATPQPHASPDWVVWHEAYDDPSSVLSRRLPVVRSFLSDALDASPAGTVRLLSACAGDGRDVLGVLERHPRAGDVEARLVELDATLAAAAAARAAAAGLERVTVSVGDAGLARWYEAAAPIHVAVCCGVFGNLATADLRQTVTALGLVVAPGGSVVWTRHRRPPDQTPDIRRWFVESGFEEVGFVQVPDSLSSVGRHLRDTSARRGELPARLFAFVGDGAGAHC